MAAQGISFRSESCGFPVSPCLRDASRAAGNPACGAPDWIEEYPANAILACRSRADRRWIAYVHVPADAQVAQR